MITKSTLFTTYFLCIIWYTSSYAQDYYGNEIDSIKHNIIEITDINVSELKLNDSPDRAIELLGSPNKKRNDIDEYSDEKFIMFYYGQDNRTLLYFYQSGPGKFLFSDFLLFDAAFSLNIKQSNFKVGESLDKLKSIYPDSYTAYQEDTSPHKSFRLIVFEDGKRMGLEIVFVIREGKIYNISTRYDE